MKDNETHLTFSISYHFLDHEQGHPRLRFHLRCKSASSVIVRLLEYTDTNSHTHTHQSHKNMGNNKNFSCSDFPFADRP